MGRRGSSSSTRRNSILTKTKLDSIVIFVNRWDENEIVEAQIGQVRYGLKRLADTFPGLTGEEKGLGREDVLEQRRPLFVYCSEGLSEETHGLLFMGRARRSSLRSADLGKSTGDHQTYTAGYVTETTAEAFWATLTI